MRPPSGTTSRVSPSALRSFSSSSDDGQALAAFAATGGEHLAPAGGGFAGAEADLARTFLSMGAECRLHDLVEKEGQGDRSRSGVSRMGLDGLWVRSPGLREPGVSGRAGTLRQIASHLRGVSPMRCKKPPAPPRRSPDQASETTRCGILKLFSLTGMILPVYRKPTGRLKIPALLLGS